MTPYQYGALNPIKFIDVNGDSIRIGTGDGNYFYYNPGQDYTGDNKFVQSIVSSLNTINSSEAGSAVLTHLSNSENNYSFENVVSKDGSGKSLDAVRFRPGESGGGTIEAGASQDVGTVAHELFHGFQIEVGMDAASTAGEVGAYLFQDVVTLQAGVPFGSSTSTNRHGKKYDAAHNNLLFNGYSERDYVSANIFFKASSKNATGLYNNKKRRFSLVGKPAIAKFLPAFK